MPMGIGPGLSVTRFESGIPGWMAGMDLGWDFTQNVQYSGATNPTDTHSATVYAQSAAGVWSPFAANTLVQTDLGLQTVPTRTNSIRNNSMVGAVPGSPGTPPTNWSASPQTGYAFSIIGTGTEFGLPYIDYRLSGTDASARQHTVFFDTSTGITAANGETWTNSAFVRLVGGTTSGLGTITLGMNENTSVGGFVTFGTQAISPTASMARYSQVRTLSGGATVARVWPWFRIDTTVGGTVDVTYRIYAPQMELGAFASAPILTTGSAAAVNGNQQVVDLTGRLSAGVGGIMQFVLPQGPAGSARVFSFDDGSVGNRVFCVADTSAVTLQMTSSDAFQGSVTALATPAISGTLYTAAFAASGNYFNMRIVGQSLPTPDTASAFPVINRLQIAGASNSPNQNGYQITKRLALQFGVQNAGTLDALFSKATILAAVS